MKTVSSHLTKNGASVRKSCAHQEMQRMTCHYSLRVHVRVETDKSNYFNKCVANRKLCYNRKIKFNEYILKNHQVGSMSLLLHARVNN